ncbi:hypothetical protein ALC62_01638 [Cyphomyrmex costatus]|uniref:Uncharacterized protein n=1 Tax=Cyphomyrmex costatus TaxID=456900 RepID=A0A195D3K2_9HYME|nr:hypothetical protein ALC62_01638 [Cyphomyrmex costatus]
MTITTTTAAAAVFDGGSLALSFDLLPTYPRLAPTPGTSRPACLDPPPAQLY